jgi:integrase
LNTGAIETRSDYINNDTVSHILWALQPANRLVCEVCLQTGWRVDDVLNIRTEDIKKAKQKKRRALTITEAKTGKRSTKYLPPPLVDELERQAGQIYVFEGRDDYRKHRTRQAVFYDVKKAAKRFNIKINLAPHSLRKNYAVYLKREGKTIEEIQKAMNHDNLLTTLIYAMSDELTEKYNKKGKV